MLLLLLQFVCGLFGCRSRSRQRGERRERERECVCVCILLFETVRKLRGPSGVKSHPSIKSPRISVYIIVPDSKLDGAWVTLIFSLCMKTCSRMLWKGCQRGCLSVKNYYKDQNDSGAVMLCSGRKLFGRPYTFCFPCVGGFIGQDPRYGTESSLLTMDQFQQRRLPIVNRCPLCKCAGEHIDHMHYSWAVQVWSFVLAVFDITWAHMGCVGHGKGTLNGLWEG